MIKIGDLVRHKYNPEPDVFGIIIDVDDYLYCVKWFDGVNSRNIFIILRFRMAKLPDYIDKTDKKAVAEYFIKQRQMAEYEKYYLEAINNLQKPYLDLYGDFNRYNTEIGEYLDSQGWKIENIAPFTWRIWKP